MDSSFRFVHHMATGDRVIEVWFGGEFVASIYPAKDGAGVRLISKHNLLTGSDRRHIVQEDGLAVVEIKVEVQP